MTYLESLEIQNFRVFHHLRIEQLGQVNLIVGQNNVGKTCLLEALRVYASGGAGDVFQDILESRYEFDPDNVVQSYENLLHGKGNHRLSTKLDQDTYKHSIETLRINPIVIGQINGAKNLRIWGGYKVDVKILAEIREMAGIVKYEGYDEVITSLMEFGYDVDTETLLHDWAFKADRRLRYESPTEYPERSPRVSPKIPVLRISADQKVKFIMIQSDFPEIGEVGQITYEFISTKNFDIKTVLSLWNEIYLTDLQDDVVAILRIIEPNVIDVGLGAMNTGFNRPIPMVRFSGMRYSIRLSSLGEGMTHLFELALAMVNIRDGMLLIDEIENGIYHGVQIQLWKFIFEVAQRLNIQVFATTHSDDMIRAFYQAGAENKEVDNALISLRQNEREPGNIVGLVFDENDLERVTRARIEVR